MLLILPLRLENLAVREESFFRDKTPFDDDNGVKCTRRSIFNVPKDVSSLRCNQSSTTISLTNQGLILPTILVPDAVTTTLRTNYNFRGLTFGPDRDVFALYRYASAIRLRFLSSPSPWPVSKTTDQSVSGKELTSEIRTVQTRCYTRLYEPLESAKVRKTNVSYRLHYETASFPLYWRLLVTSIGKHLAIRGDISTLSKRRNPRVRRLTINENSTNDEYSSSAKL